MKTTPRRPPARLERHESFGRPEGPVFCAVGTFDGCHRGHLAVFGRAAAARDAAGGGSVVVISFRPHPAAVVSGRVPPPPLQSVRQKLAVLGAAGVDLFVPFRFTKAMAETSAADFLDRYVIGGLGCRRLFVGEDAAVGKGREGDAAFMASRLARAGGSVDVVRFVTEEGAKLGSSGVRRALAAGDVRAARVLLGRPFSVEGVIRPGARRGRLLGFPTVNLRPGGVTVPADGVYVTAVIGERGGYRGVTSVGTNPTFTSPSGEALRTVETYVLTEGLGVTGGPGLTGVLASTGVGAPPVPTYGERIEVGFVAKIRDNERFGSAAELAARISLDVRAAAEGPDAAAAAAAVQELAPWAVVPARPAAHESVSRGPGGSR